jgi:uncharacterized protein
MRRLFVDTGAFVAKEIAGDQYHPLASRGWNEASKGDVQLVSSEHVLDESATLIARRTTYAWASEWGRDVLETEIEWLRAESDEWRKALLLMRKFADQKVSFTDCLSAVLMKRAGIKTVFGFDRHFEAMGFRIWPAD